MSASAAATSPAGTDAPDEGAGMRASVVIVSLVHPDLLPPLHAFARCLVDEGYAPRFVTFDSPAAASGAPAGVSFEIVGRHRGSAWARARARRRFARMVRDAIARERPALIVAACPTSLLAATAAARGTPIVYWAFEMYVAGASDFLRSPLTSLRNRRAFRAARRVALVCAPSEARAKWIADRARLSRTPAVVLNAPYLGRETSGHAVAGAASVPERFRRGRLVLHTGGVSRTQAVHELVRSMSEWPADARLVITNVGDSEYARTLRQLVSASPRADDVLLLPLLPRDELRAIQSLGTVGVCLLRREGVLEAMMPAPNKLGEYLAAGLHVLALRDPYFDPIAGAGVAELVASLEPVEIGRAVRALLDRASEPGARERATGVARAWYNMRHQMEPVRALLVRNVG